MMSKLIQLWLLFCLAVISYIDFKRQIIPDICLLLMLPAAFSPAIAPQTSAANFPAAVPQLSAANPFSAGAASIPAFELPPRSHFLAAGVPIALFLLMALIAAILRQDTPIGMGDIKLLAVIGLISGPAVLLFTATVGSLACGSTAATLLLTKKATKKSRIAFGPFLSIAYALCLFCCKPA